MNIQEIKAFFDGLADDNTEVFHRVSKDPGDRYIVWAEDSEGGSGHADNKKTTYIMQGTIDLFTRTDFDSKKEDIENALLNSNFAWKLNSIQSESDTRYHHFEWIWEIDYG